MDDDDVGGRLFAQLDVRLSNIVEVRKIPLVQKRGVEEKLSTVTTGRQRTGTPAATGIFLQPAKIRNTHKNKNITKEGT